MKTVKKKVEMRLDTYSVSDYGFDSFRRRERVYHYVFTSDEYIPNVESLEFYVKVEEPETIGEFICVHNISREDLIDWLNKNYKK